MNGGEASRSPLACEHLDGLFRVLADERCRLTLWYLDARTDGVARVDELVAYIVEVGSVTDEERARVQFHHVVLPRLYDHGFVEYDQRSRTVKYRRRPRLERILDAIGEEALV